MLPSLRDWTRLICLSISLWKCRLQATSTDNVCENGFNWKGYKIGARWRNWQQDWWWTIVRTKAIAACPLNNSRETINPGTFSMQGPTTTATNLQEIGAARAQTVRFTHSSTIKNRKPSSFQMPFKAPGDAAQLFRQLLKATRQNNNTCWRRWCSLTLNSEIESISKLARRESTVLSEGRGVYQRTGKGGW